MPVMWQQISPAAYQIASEDILTLPTQRHLRRLTSALDMNLEITDSTIAYQQARKSKLSTNDLLVNVIMDEVFCKKKCNILVVNFTGLKTIKLLKGNFV